MTRSGGGRAAVAAAAVGVAFVLAAAIGARGADRDAH